MFYKKRSVRFGLSLALSCTMAFGTVPTIAFAEGEPNLEELQTSAQNESPTSPDVIRQFAEGLAGEDATGRLDALWDALAAVEIDDTAEANGSAGIEAALSGEKSSASVLTHAFALVATELGFTVEETVSEEKPIARLEINGEVVDVDVATGEPGAYPWANDALAQEEQGAEGEESKPDVTDSAEEVAGGVEANTPPVSVGAVQTQAVETPGAAEAAEGNGDAALGSMSVSKTDTKTDSGTTTDLSKARITVSKQAYTGKPVEPKPTVKLGNATLVQGTDYDVSYAKNTEVGTATVTVKGKGAYTGSASAQFSIVAPSVSYMVHVQKIGDQAWCKDGKSAGTVGQSKRLEAIKIKLDSGFPIAGGIRYRTHVQKEGWQGWKQDGVLSGTEGKSRRLEAICIELTGDLKKAYDVYYRVHAQKVGWMSWAKNGQEAGTMGMSWRLESIQIRLVPQGMAAPSAAGSVTSLSHLSNPGLKYRAHVQTYGWRDWKKNGALAGTENESKRLEALEVALDSDAVPGGVKYKTHVQTYGWQDWRRNGALSGTEHESKRLEAVAIELEGEVAKYFDVWYRTHVQSFGWLGWTKNGGLAGTAKLSRRMEAMQIMLVPKDAAAPGDTEKPFLDTDYRLSGDPELDAITGQIVAQTGSGIDGLHRAYDYIRGFNYHGGNLAPDVDWRQWSIPYAKEMYRNGGGNCYRFAALMGWTARRLGFDAVVVKGYVNAGELLNHGWVEVTLDGQVYMIDAEMGNPVAAPEYYWCMIKYADAHLKYFDLNGNRILK